MEEPDKKKPRKPRRRTKKKAKAVTDSGGKQEPTSSLGSLSALFAFEECSQRRRHNDNVKAMCSQIEEYLSNFIVIGYTVDGAPVTVTCARTQKDLDSLSTSLHKYLLDRIQGDQFPPGNSF